MGRQRQDTRHTQTLGTCRPGVPTHSNWIASARYTATHAHGEGLTKPLENTQSPNSRKFIAAQTSRRTPRHTCKCPSQVNTHNPRHKGRFQSAPWDPQQIFQHKLKTSLHMHIHTQAGRWYPNGHTTDTYIDSCTKPQARGRPTWRV